MRQEHWADFWEHVDDLRRTLVQSLLVIGLGFLILLMFYQPILQFLTSSSSSLVQTEQGWAKQRIERIRVVNQTIQDKIFDLPSHAWLISNISPLTEGGSSYRLAPGQAVLYEEVIHPSLLIMSPIEGLILVFKTCFWLSIALTAPIWSWIWLQFILPGLKEQERAVLFPFLLCSLFCLSLGMTLAYSITLPIANQYLLLFNHSIGQNAWTLKYYIDYVLLLCLGHAIAAELALCLLVLVHFRFLSPEWLIAKRRYMIVLAFILATLLTPPDVFTQLLLAIPLICLYEIAIWYGTWRRRTI